MKRYHYVAIYLSFRFFSYVSPATYSISIVLPTNTNFSSLILNQSILSAVVVIFRHLYPFPPIQFQYFLLIQENIGKPITNSIENYANPLFLIIPDSFSCFPQIKDRRIDFLYNFFLFICYLYLLCVIYLSDHYTSRLCISLPVLIRSLPAGIFIGAVN